MKIIRRFAAYFLATTVLVFPHLASAAGTPLQLHDGDFIGRSVDAYYGLVQVQATVQGGAVVSVKTLKFPNHSGESRSINRRALPILQQEVLARQAGRIDIVSGATLTSRAYAASLRDALVQSRK